MTHDALADILRLSTRFVAITCVREAGAISPPHKGGALALLRRALAGETITLAGDGLSCSGAATGFGFCDGLPPVPGGFGHFVSSGRGEGFPPGERIKRTPALGEAMLLGQPQDVMAGYSAVVLSPYDGSAGADLVTAQVTPDQLSALIHLFCYDSPRYDNIIAPMTSGCASVFRIPFGELAAGDMARAVIGNVDVFSRPHFPKDTFFLTVPGDAFRRMLAIGEESVLASPIFRGVASRL